ncbi:MAG: 16S rRNA (uracil(1498)-N(3))-methyltransferase [Bacteroidetes bacterium]|nr:16S rRNA (uracil(1498)-N(3))-methyltransferase [Bacteroidota bacterium]
MILFYTTDIRGGSAWFSEEEARHCSQVLRRKTGDVVQFLDGLGGWYEGVISEVNKRQVVVEVTDRRAGTDLRNFRLHLAIAPTKNIDRFEWFLEKATEIGIHEITPLQTGHSERTKLRYDRLEKILLAAMKQSMRTWLPKLNELTDFEHFIKKTETPDGHARFIAHCREENLPHLKNNCPAATDVTLLIGPEGDFSPAEISLANEAGFKNISLGTARLRTETAGIVACHIINLLND